MIAPYVAGGGKPALHVGMALRLELQGHESFGSGMAYLSYRVEPANA